jgi:hypothetical protein
MNRRSIYSYLVNKTVALSIGATTFLAVALLAAEAAPESSNELRADTVSAWDEYVRSADLRLQARLDGAVTVFVDG